VEVDVMLGSHTYLDRRQDFGSGQDTHALFSQTMGYVATTSGLFALGGFLGRNLSYGWGWVFYVTALVCLIAMNFAVRRSNQGALGLLFAFGAMLGLGTGPTMVYYAAGNPAVLWEASGATALFMAGLGAAGYATRRDFSPLGRLSFWALIGLIVFGVVAILLQIPHASLIYSVVGLVIFAGLVLFDFQRLRARRNIDSAPLLAASIFLDAINVFLFFLRIFSNRRD
jgi:FtsH-binding integral membrane protein